MKKPRKQGHLGRKRKNYWLIILRKWIINLIGTEYDQSIRDFIKDLIDNLQDWFDDP
ncbi:hypothetical protein [Wohlfahrtiimonas larvae]|uniref:Transposase n=1 Tax=Wohlfahrtiimonas larvae TaxID=1157986 RepID=A0ABP9ME75_9GAMM|nr:hypothetical protein [Wohlfahrtiimonas larvae]